MHIDVIGRIRASQRGEGPHTLEIDGHNRLASRPGGTYFSFQALYKQTTSTYDIFKQSVGPLVDLYIAGYNVCMVLTGESNSGKSYTVAGETMNKSGLVPILIDHLFTNIGEESRYMYDNPVQKKQAKVSLQMYEIYNELVKDLLTEPGNANTYLEIQESAERSVHVKNGSVVPINNSADATALFRQGWARRNNKFTDLGPAKNYSSVIIYLDLTFNSGDNLMPNKSRFTIVVAPGTEKLAEDSTQIRLKEGPTLNKSLVSLSQVVSSLASQPFADRTINYSDSKLTQILRDELGGNFKTRVLVCLKPHVQQNTLAPLLRIATQFSQIKNFPIVNDPFAQQLLTQYRARVISLQNQLGSTGGLGTTSPVHDVMDELRRVQTENLHLRDKNERLQQKLEMLQGKFGALANNKTDLSAQLIMTEEEKLKVSKTLVEMQIDNNKIREESEAGKFELTNKILQLENDMMELEIERDKNAKMARNAKERLADIEKDRKDLADEYVSLKTNYLALTKAYEKETAKNEELSMELLNLVNAKAALMRQMDAMEVSTSLERQPSAEVERVRNIVSRLAFNKFAPPEYKMDQNLQLKLYGDAQKYKEHHESLKKQFDEDQQKLEAKLSNLYRDLRDARNLARERQKKISELNSQLVTAKLARDEDKTENNRLQHRLKDLSEEYRARLIKYVEDIAAYVDSGGKTPARQISSEKMQEYVDDMLKDIRRAHKNREDQLSQAAQSYRNRTENVVKRHEELLYAYRELRHEVGARGMDDIDLGPDENNLMVDDAELHSHQQREIYRLRDELVRAKAEIESLQLRQRYDDKTARVDSRVNQTDGTGENWGSLRKQLRDFTLNTQQQLEEERAELITKNQVLQEQLHESQTYIDNHLVRYKQEIIRLRSMLGIENDGLKSPPYLSDRSKRKGGRSYRQ